VKCEPYHQTTQGLLDTNSGYKEAIFATFTSGLNHHEIVNILPVIFNDEELGVERELLQLKLVDFQISFAQETHHIVIVAFLYPILPFQLKSTKYQDDDIVSISQYHTRDLSNQFFIDDTIVAKIVQLQLTLFSILLSNTAVNQSFVFIMSIQVPLITQLTCIGNMLQLASNIHRLSHFVIIYLQL
jgi:hypothetical protein